MNTIPRNTTTSVDLWRVLDAMGIEDNLREAIYDYGFDDVTFGDSAYTLIGAEHALMRIQSAAWTHYRDYSEMDPQDPEYPAHIYGQEELAELFWQCVTKDEYINLEG